MSAKTVIVYKPVLLPYSETFIKEQIASYSRWHGILVGRQLTNEIPLNGIDVKLLHSGGSPLLDRVRWDLWSRWRAVPGFVGKQLAHLQADLFHAHFGTVGVAAQPIAGALDLPMVVTLHGSDITIHKEWWKRGGGGKKMRHYPDRLLELARQPRIHFIAVSEAVKECAVAYGIHPNRISTLYIGIDTDRFVPSGKPLGERRPRVIFIGRLVEKKGCSYLLKAFVSVQQSIPDAELIIIGNGELRNGLESAAKDMRLRARFLGVVPPDTVRSQLHTARVLCLPSITASNGDREGLPTVIVEAQACGIPVVTSAFGGALEGIIPGKTGFAFPEKEVDELAMHLITLLRDNGLAEKMSRAARRFAADKFNIRSCTAQLESLYDRIARE